MQFVHHTTFIVQQSWKIRQCHDRNLTVNFNHSSNLRWKKGSYPEHLQASLLHDRLQKNRVKGFWSLHHHVSTLRIQIKSDRTLHRNIQQGHQISKLIVHPSLLPTHDLPHHHLKISKIGQNVSNSIPTIMQILQLSKPSLRWLHEIPLRHKIPLKTVRLSCSGLLHLPRKAKDVLHNRLLQNNLRRNRKSNRLLRHLINIHGKNNSLDKSHQKRWNQYPIKFGTETTVLVYWILHQLTYQFVSSAIKIVHLSFIS